MSGGMFDYKETVIKEIADMIADNFYHATKVRPAKVKRHYVSIRKKTGERSYEYDLSRGGLFSKVYNFQSLEEFKKEFFAVHTKYHIIDERENLLLVEDTKTQSIYEVTCVERETYEIEGYYPDYSEDTLREFENAIRVLRHAEIYARRFDRLICGDDSEETFHERLKDELNELETIK